MGYGFWQWNFHNDYLIDRSTASNLSENIVNLSDKLPTTSSFYEDGEVFITHDTTQFPPEIPQGIFCFTLEGDCSGTIQAGEEKACTVKNYLRVGVFAVPQTNGATTTTGTIPTSQSNNAITTTPTTTHSSNVGGISQSSNVGSTHYNNTIQQYRST